VEVSAVSFPAYDGTDINARSDSGLENAQLVLENARSQSPEGNKSELEILKQKILNKTM
jgi:phage head maturation protease